MSEQSIHKILITGHKGTIGSVLMNGLAGFELTGVDLPEVDVCNYDALKEAMVGMHAVIHTAQNTNDENDTTPGIRPENVTMWNNVLWAAHHTGSVRRVILSSSVHADNFIDHLGAGLLVSPGSYHPRIDYGTHKLVMEGVAGVFAQQTGLDIIAPRFGGVTPDDLPETYHPTEPLVWLSHADLIRAITCCLSAPIEPGRFEAFYAVSANTGRLHDTTNIFDWVPKDDSADVMRAN